MTAFQPRPRETNLLIKKNRILREIFRRGQCSRLELARRLNINASMVGKYVEQFTAEGLLCEVEATPLRRGRAPVPLRLNRERGCFLGLDFEALRARVVLTGFDGEVLHQQETPFRANVSRAGVLKRIVELTEQAAAAAETPLLAISIAAPGQLDAQQGTIVDYVHLRNFSNVPLRAHFEARFDVPVHVEDNVRALTLAEMLRGAGRGHRNLLCLVARSGVGLGIVIDGRLYAGNLAMAGDLGKTVLPQPDGPQTVSELVSAKGFVGRVKRLVRSASRTKLRRALLQQGDDLSLADIVRAAEGGDALLLAALDQLGETLGLVAANLANLLAPEKIVLAGDVPPCCERVRNSLRQAFRRHAVPRVFAATALADGELSGYAGALGAAYHGFLETFPSDEASLAPPPATEPSRPTRV